MRKFRSFHKFQMVTLKKIVQYIGPTNHRKLDNHNNMHNRLVIAIAPNACCILGDISIFSFLFSKKLTMTQLFKKNSRRIIQIPSKREKTDQSYQKW